MKCLVHVLGWIALLTVKKFRNGILLANGFATPKLEFLLEIDGNSISTSREHLCAIEKKLGGGSLGGRARCWGNDHIDGRTDPPQDVSLCFDSKYSIKFKVDRIHSNCDGFIFLMWASH
jgi:hypothetical protein